MSKPELPTQMSRELAIDILKKTLQILESPEIAPRLDKFRENAGNDIMQIMQYVFPEVMLIQMDVIKQFGFPGSREGILRFAQLIKEVEKEDPEVETMHGLVKAYYLPAVNVNTTEEEKPGTS